MGRFGSVLYWERRPGGSARAFACALEVAEACDASLTVVGVVGRSHDGEGVIPLAAGAAERRKAITGRWRRGLDGLASMGAARGVEVEVVLVEGDGCEEAVGVVERGGHDLLMTVADPGPFWPWRLSASDRRLLRRCPCPAWILHPAQGPGLRVLVAAVDVGDGRLSGVDREVVRVAACLSEVSGAQLHVVHAWSLPGETVMASPTRGVGRRRTKRFVAEARRARRRWVERLLALEAPDRPARVVLRKGGTVAAIREVARRREADVVVVGGGDRTGLGAALFGNVAERVVGWVPGSVLAVTSPVSEDRRLDPTTAPGGAAAAGERA
jgi:universal stress protein E